MSSKTMPGQPRHHGLTRRGVLVAGAIAPVLAGCDDDDKKVPLVGHRTDILSSGDALVVDSEDKTAITIPAPITVSEWPVNGRVLDHTGRNYAWGGLHARWRRSIGAGISEPSLLAWAALGSLGRGIIQCEPIIHGGRLFMMDAQGVIRAFSWPGMRHEWTFNPRPKHLRSSNLGGGLGADGDTLYIVDGVSQALAVNVATGKVKWRTDIGVPGRSAPTIAEGRVFFGTIDERFYALDAATGRQLWSYAATTVETTVFGQPAPAYANGVVVAGFGGGDLVAFRAASGEVVWAEMLGNVNSQASTLNLSCVRGMPVIVGSVVYAVSMAQVLAAVDIRTGRRVWERSVASLNNILIVGDWLFVLSLDQQLACLDRLSGHVRWITQFRRFRKLDKDKDIVTWFGPVLAGGQLVCLSTLPENGMVRVDPATGRIISVDAMDSPACMAPIIVDGQMLIATNEGYLRSYG
ncbi:PQQ-like beta-propeller repeat protein [Acetobacter peroxydans]|jgi:outer membrane protein assembly factor BamB|uniref:PQQ-like beta-propeller repeat protein n=1 Tax=Acetobacter peroxydans TaxID=104098 RepID=UPI0023572E00|nr:PQQ-like beta-propeller repeat protein [Acetobacter peroxydans]MCH4142487.1 PQQ-like beta-propeller repeat protein [Acetobacter peroxydans]MCI1410698.1 PQQ-like beta-propeller repeat protein [Acetobacter peroxydans]MCI1440272.1 PQQ-like beta-propeller repeat protein [Acetobacter peroxydans]MCI1565970.1 PQQ-like beta-propeller repeat protein [Acetobacter peroxydans]MCI1618133.1 PQQ-like beta-propeller repeat protein [Acetobacter peroxydans]